MRAKPGVVLGFALLTATLASCAGAGSGSSNSACYVSWTCSSSQCASVMGGYSGSAGPFADDAACEKWRHDYILSSTCSCGGTPSAPSQRTLQSITVTPATATVPKGLSTTFAATGTYSDGTSGDVTSQATWASSNTSVAYMTGAYASADSIGTSTVTATVGSLTATATLTVTAAALESVTVTPATPTVVKSLTVQLYATGHYSDGTSQDLTASASWASNQPSVAPVAPGGLVTGAGTGAAYVSASAGGKMAGTTVTVVAAALRSITVTPANPTLPVGVAQQFTATGSYSDGTTHDITATVTWASSSVGVAAVSTGGLVDALAIGTATITATSGAISGSTLVTVSPVALLSISVAPGTVTVPAGIGQNFTATGHYSDGTTQDLTATATWSSSATSIATVVAGGAATAVSSGTATVRATSGTVSGSATLTVSAATLTSIAIAPAAPSVTVHATLQLAAIGTYSDGTTNDLTALAAWSSASPALATVAAGGLASGLATGTAAVRATFGGVTGSANLTVVPPGAIWTDRSPASLPFLKAVASSGSRWVAVGSRVIATSTDGKAWTFTTSVAANLSAVTWTGTQFVAVGQNIWGSYVCLTSPDAGTWATAGTWPSQGAVIGGVAWSGSQFVAVDNTGSVYTSPDGSAWTTHAAGFAFSGNVLWTGSQFVAAGMVLQSPYTKLIGTSADGVTWTQHGAGTTQGQMAGVWTGSQLVFVGNGGAVLTSPDGNTWALHTTGPDSPMFGISWSGAQFVAVGDTGAIYDSADAGSWAPVVSGTTLPLSSVAWSGSQFVAVGGNDPGVGVIVSSP